MLANFLNKSKPINFISLLIFFFIGYIITLVFNFMSDGFTTDELIKGVVLLVLFLGVFFFYNFIVSKNKLTHDNSYAYFIFTTLNISIIKELTEYKIIILFLIYLLFIRKIYSLRSLKKVLEKLFDSGFWLGILFILEPLSIFLFLFIYAGVYAHKKVTIHTLLTPIIGFITPLFVYFTYFFWIDEPENFTKLFYFDVIFNIDFYTNTKYFWLINSLFFITTFVAIIKSIKAISVNNTFRKSWILVIINFLVLVILLLFFPNKNGSELILILFPISVILANGIELIQKQILKNLAIYMLLVGCIAFQLFL